MGLLFQNSLEVLKNSKNLLGFSAGVDSTALFFLLVENNIEFDIAIVDYCKREQSKLEVEYAKELAAKYGKKCYAKEVRLGDSNFEASARLARYEFFEEIIFGRILPASNDKHSNGFAVGAPQDYRLCDPSAASACSAKQNVFAFCHKNGSFSYQNLILAHQLNDSLEWFLMQFTKGAGLLELFGMETIEARDGYKIVRPLLNTTKQELEAYLKQNGIKYFIDESNSDKKYKRNYFRHNFSERLLHEFESGIKNSLEYLKTDIEILKSFSQIHQEKELFIIQKSGIDRLDIANIDKALKKLGLLATKEQKDEILKTKDCVMGGKIAVCYTKEQIFVAPYIKSTMSKEFKEQMRIKKMPPKIRGYIYTNMKGSDDKPK